MNEKNEVNSVIERRTEQRLRYHWPVWFAKDFNGTLSQGQMVDVSSGGAAFTCSTEADCPYMHQDITARFSVPRFGEEDYFDMANFTRLGQICRVEQVNRFLHRIAIQFAEPLPFKPAEQTESDSATEKKLKAVTI